jgi:DNA-binding LacI/PurR family transcriptional regulator/DNA-binding transcriptional regulator YhcF (GntR family)
MQRAKFDTIAHDLESRITGKADYILPSITELAHLYRVAYQTMWKAVQVLVRKGVLATSPGKRVARAPDPESATPGDLALSADKLCETVRHRIQSGVYQAGKPFPKIDYFVVTEHVSPLTVTRMFRRLSEENLAHQIKRRWIVGPAPKRPAQPARIESSMSSSPIAVIVYTDAQDWSQLISTSFVNSFFHPFSNELLAHHILIAPAFFHRAGGQSIAAPTGMDEIVAFVRDLGRRYVGTIIHAVFPREEKLEDHVTRLVPFGKPVIHFDSADRGGYITRQLLEIKKTFYRLHQDERAAVRLVLNAIVDRGHRTIGIHGREIGGWWSERRTDAFKELALSYNPAPEIVLSGPFEPNWGYEKHQALHDYITTIARKAQIEEPFADLDPETKQHFRRLLIENAPSLVSMLVNDKPTALASLLDRMAREYHYWLQALAINVPQQLSLVSFDNSPETSFFPISTIDWGFAQLAYLAAHIIIGDIPIHADRAGHIAGACRLIDRGSIGPAPEAREIAEMVRKLRT